MQQFLTSLNDLAPRAVLVLLVMIIITIVHRVILRRIETFVQGFLARREFELTQSIVEALTTPIRLLVLAVAILFSVRILRPDEATRLFSDGVIRTLVIMAGSITLYRFVDILAFSSKRVLSITGIRMDERLIPYLRNGVKLLVGVLILLVILQEWGVNVSALIASLGIVGLAFSLAAQDTVSNLFGFGTIVGDRPFVVGEYIVSPHVEGIVEEVGLRSTRVRKPDRALATVPNAILANSTVERFALRRINFTLGVTYETTADEMEALVERLRLLLKERHYVRGDSIAVYFVGFGESSLDITMQCDVLHRDWRMFMQERETINLKVMRIVAEMGLSVAFPTRSLYIDKLPMEHLRAYGTTQTITGRERPDAGDEVHDDRPTSES